jgi:ParB family chromosome partitioning protein
MATPAHAAAKPASNRVLNRSRESILRALSEGQVRSDDRRALFVGAKAYEQAGGIIVRDLFNAEGGGFFADAELLNRLAHEKLQVHADKVAKEGWRWVVAELEFDHEACARMRRVFAKPVPLSKSERKRLRKLQARLDHLYEKHGECDVPADTVAEIEASIDTLQREEFKPRDIALAALTEDLMSAPGPETHGYHPRAEFSPR